MPVTHSHHLQPLASADGYVVQFCPVCEIVHVDVGPVTLRLRPGALDSLARVLAAASAQMHRAEPEAPTLRIARPLN